MITKGIIESIDFLSNTCMVRLPIFEGTTKIPAVLPATFSITPGTYSYKQADIVYVGFENNALNRPIVLGKLFIDSKTEADTSGTITCGTLTVKEQATLPISTKIEYTKDPDTANLLGSTSITAIGDLITYVQALEDRVSTLETLMNEVRAPQTSDTN